MKRCLVFCLIVFIYTTYALISGSGGEKLRVKDQNLIDEYKQIQSKNNIKGVKPDIDFGKIPLYFLTNQGQVDDKVKFYAKASRYTLWMTLEGLVFDGMGRSQGNRQEGIGKRGKEEEKGNSSELNSKFKIQNSELISRDVSRLMFVGANKNPEIIPVKPAKLKVNYFIGNDRSKWMCDVPTSMAVLYKDLYENIDLKVYGIEKEIEYDWIVKPGSDPGDIKFEYKNVKKTRIDEEGNLIIETGLGELMHKRPFAYQMNGDEKFEVVAEFEKIDKNTYGFKLGDYDRSRELIIDPVVLAYSTYLGGSSGDVGWGIVVDRNGYVYVAGQTSSRDFPSKNAYQGDKLGVDVFVTKFDPSQSNADSLLYATYLGGNSHDRGYGIAVDDNGYVYVTGETYSSDFPTSLNPYQVDLGRSDIFVTKLDPSKSGVSSLLYSTYLGGSGYEGGMSIAVDGSGNAYVTGFTDSRNFPIKNQYQENLGDRDVFVTKLDLSKSGSDSLLYSTYLGGGIKETGYGIAVDDSGYVYVTGETESTDFPTKNSYQGNQGGNDAFVSMLDPSKSGFNSLFYSTYLGGDRIDRGYGIAVDGSGYVYVTGLTESTDFPTKNEYQGYQGGGDAFVTKLDPSKSGSDSLLYSTCLGGGYSDYGYGIAVDGGGNVYVTGVTRSIDFPTKNEYQTHQEGRDAFVTMLDPSTGASGLLYSTYLGGEGEDYGWGIAVDSSGNVYVTGETESIDFPTKNEYQGDPGDSDSDAFITKLSYPLIIDTPTSVAVSYTTATLGGNVSDAGGSDVTERGVYWSTIDGFTPPGEGTRVWETGSWGTGTFSLDVTGLPSSSIIYFKVFANNSEGTGYSNQASFTTLAFVVPTLSTTAASNITSNSAGSGGNVTSKGGVSITARGVCWSTSSNPTIALATKTSDGRGIGRFSSLITGLNPVTTYYVRAYAKNSVGTSYGNERSFTTDAVLPTLTTTAISNITSNSSNSGGNVTSNGGASVTGRGVCWSTSANPTIADPKTSDGSGTGTFTSAITGLNPDTESHVRAYATNAIGTAYGEEVSFTTDSLQPPSILLSRTYLNFGSDNLKTTADQDFIVYNSGGSALNWTLLNDASWLSCTPISGTGTALLINVSVDTAGLSAGTYTGIINIIDSNAENSPQTVKVSLVVKDQGSTSAPFGSFDTPIEGSTVRSSIAVTGWALDDVEVEALKIYRDPVSGEGSGLIYIGDAFFVEGARPDIEALYSNYPLNYRAGWGYMLLTNFFPDNGNGSFVLYAKAVDKEGNETLLGSKTINCDNKNAVKPFGAIDTPVQGGIASGGSFVNFGWALTPQPNTIPKDGSTINVYIDGVPLGNPVYNIYRADIATLFPGYNNSNGAVGYFHIDTNAYENGTHTIQWSAEDNAGNIDGIGSRYFTVQNTSSDKKGVKSKKLKVESLKNINKYEISKEPIEFIKGFSNSRLTPHASRLTIKELERTILNLNLSDSKTTYSGYLKVGNDLRKLPIGSSLKDGKFYWSPGPGFIGKYDFVFIDIINKTKKEIKIIIKPVFEFEKNIIK